MQAHAEGTPQLAMRMGFAACSAVTAVELARRGRPGPRAAITWSSAILPYSKVRLTRHHFTSYSSSAVESQGICRDPSPTAPVSALGRDTGYGFLLTCGSRVDGRWTEGGNLARFAEHLVDFACVKLLGVDHLSGVLLNDDRM
jgi:hypothetical protein